MKKLKVKDYFFLFLIAVILVAVIIGNVVCYYQSGVITTALCGTGVSFEGDGVQESVEQGDALCREMGEESIVLLKNNNTLPLSGKSVTLFGVSSASILYGGGGSGAVDTSTA